MTSRGFEITSQPSGAGEGGGVLSHPHVGAGWITGVQFLSTLVTALICQRSTHSVGNFWRGGGRDIQRTGEMATGAM